MILIVLPDIAVEDRLLARARHGDVEALRQIYEAYFSPIFNFIRLRVDDVNTAEDLASEVFVRLVESFRGGSPPRKTLRGWLFRVARNVLHAHYGKAERFTEIALDEWLVDGNSRDIDTTLIRGIAPDQLRQAVRQLPFAQQETIILRFGHMLSLEETADVMGKNVGAVKALQFRAINRLRRILSVEEMDA